MTPRLTLPSSKPPPANWRVAPTLLPLLPLLDHAHLTPALDVLTERQPQTLDQALSQAHDSNLLGLFGHLPEGEEQRVAKALKNHATDSWQAFVARNSDAQEIASLKAQLG